MNKYRLPVDAYDRKHEQTISSDAIKDKLINYKSTILSLTEEF